MLVFSFGGKLGEKKVRRREQDDQLLRGMNAQRKERARKQRRREGDYDPRVTPNHLLPLG